MSVWYCVDEFGSKYCREYVPGQPVNDDIEQLAGPFASAAACGAGCSACLTFLISESEPLWMLPGVIPGFPAGCWKYVLTITDVEGGVAPYLYFWNGSPGVSHHEFYVGPAEPLNVEVRAQDSGTCSFMYETTIPSPSVTPPTGPDPFPAGFYKLSAGGTCEHIVSPEQYDSLFENSFVLDGPFGNCDECSSGSGSGSGSGAISGSGSGSGSVLDCTSRIGVYYRDLKFDLDSAEWSNHELHKAHIAVETRDDCEKEECRYNVQIGITSSSEFATNFSEDAWSKHKIVLPSHGVAWGEPTVTPTREQKFKTISIPDPTTKVRLRIRFSPLYDLWPFETGSEAVVKIRPIETDGKLMVWTSNPAKMFRYTPPDARPEMVGKVGKQRAGTLELLFDGSNETLDIEDATDAAYWEKKAYVVTADGKMIVVDTDAGQQALTVTPRKEELERAASTSHRLARLTEVVGSKPLVIWSDGTLSTNKSRLYDYSFSAPKLAWESDFIYNFTAVGDGVLYLVVGNKLYASNAGTTAPTLERTFNSNITAVAREDSVIYATLANGNIWKRVTPSGPGGQGSGDPTWLNVETLSYAVTALGIWQGGASDERALAGFVPSGTSDDYEPNRMWSESVAGSWSADRLLPIPEVEEDEEELVVNGIVSMARSIGDARNTGAPNSGSEEETKEALQVADSMAIGTTGNGLLYIYTRTYLDARYGAFEACSIGVPRLVPVWREIEEEEPVEEVPK